MYPHHYTDCFQFRAWRYNLSLFKRERGRILICTYVTVKSHIIFVIFHRWPSEDSWWTFSWSCCHLASWFLFYTDICYTVLIYLWLMLQFCLYNNVFIDLHSSEEYSLLISQFCFIFLMSHGKNSARRLAILVFSMIFLSPSRKMKGLRVHLGLWAMFTFGWFRRYFFRFGILPPSSPPPSQSMSTLVYHYP